VRVITPIAAGTRSRAETRSPTSGPFDVTVAGVGSLATFLGSGSCKIPSEFRRHQDYRGMELQATGSIVAGSSLDATFDLADMSQVSGVSV
jgi:hypothetical protein